jgi:malonate transporter
MTTILLYALAPVFLTLGLGWFAGTTALIDNRQTASINLLLMNFALPASLFVAMARTPVAVLHADAWLALVFACVMLCVYGATWWFEIGYLKNTRQEAAVQSLTVAFPNCAAVGLSLLPTVYGAWAASVAAIGIAVGAVVISPLTIAILQREQDKEATGAHAQFVLSFLSAFRRPVVFAPVAGVLLSVSGVGLHDLAAKSLLLMGEGAAGIALFLTGIILSAQRFRFSASMGMGLLLKNLIQPILIFLILRAVHVPIEMIAAAVLLAAVPAGFFGAVFGARFNVSSPEASATLVASTLLSVLTLSATIVLLRALH